jgi:hypothetical protein
MEFPHCPERLTLRQSDRRHASLADPSFVDDGHFPASSDNVHALLSGGGCGLLMLANYQGRDWILYAVVVGTALCSERAPWAD